MLNDVNGRPIYITPSMLSTGGKCQLQLRWFYQDRMRFKPGFAAEVGNAFHKPTLEVDQPRHLLTGEWTPLEELETVATEHLQAMTPEIDKADDWVNELGGREKAYVKAQTLAHSMLGEYVLDRSRLSGRGFEVEFGYKTEIPFGGALVRGRIDIDVNDNHIRDVKTRRLYSVFDPRTGRKMPKGKRRAEPEVHNDAQFAVLAAVKAKVSGIPYQRVDASCMYAIDQVKKVGAEFETVPTVHTEEQHKLIEERAYRLYRAMEQDTLVPVDKGSSNGWICSARFCGAWEQVCPFGRRGQVTV